jgi:hypothetical protein
MAKGVQTDGIVLAKFSCAEPSFKADGVVLFAVPAKGLTYLTGDCSCANAHVHIISSSDIKNDSFLNMLVKIKSFVNSPVQSTAAILQAAITQATNKAGRQL